VKVKCDVRTLFFTESVANVVAHRFGVRPRRTKLLSALARPVVYALGAMNRGAVLTVHADKDRSVTDMLFRQRESMRSGGTAG